MEAEKEIKQGRDEEEEESGRKNEEKRTPQVLSCDF
jgi:hypothetical protein